MKTCHRKASVYVTNEYNHIKIAAELDNDFFYNEQLLLRIAKKILYSKLSSNMICTEWTGSVGFERFQNWFMVNVKSDLNDFSIISLERFDDSKEYSPTNCYLSYSNKE